MSRPAIRTRGQNYEERRASEMTDDDIEAERYQLHVERMQEGSAFEGADWDRILQREQIRRLRRERSMGLA